MTKGCCSCDSDCCGNEEKRKVIIEFLYLDLSVCERCQGTENSLEMAVEEVSGILKAAGFELIVNKTNINTEELAIKHQFISSPTIRVNGRDIDLSGKETNCKDCGDLCGDDVDCRVWEYEGREYDVPPKALIINAILKEVYSSKDRATEQGQYELPENLKRFFRGIKKR